MSGPQYVLNKFELFLLGIIFFLNREELFLQWLFTMYKPQRRPRNLEIATEPTHQKMQRNQSIGPKPLRADLGRKPDSLVPILQ